MEHDESMMQSIIGDLQMAETSQDLQELPDL